MKRAKIGVLGYGPGETSIYEGLSDLGFDAFQVNLIELLGMKGEFDLVVSYGLKELIPSRIIEVFSPINLHISFLPYNRGYYPNFWSFAENSPTGISIHLVDSGIDTGNILFQEAVDLDPRTHTFVESYLILRKRIEILFVQNIASLVFENLDGQPQRGQGSFHKRSELPKEFLGWHRNVREEIERLRELYDFQDFGFR